MMNCVVEKIFPSQNPDGGSAYMQVTTGRFTIRRCWAVTIEGKIVLMSRRQYWQFDQDTFLAVEPQEFENLILTVEKLFEAELLQNSQNF